MLTELYVYHSEGGNMLNVKTAILAACAVLLFVPYLAASPASPSKSQPNVKPSQNRPGAASPPVASSRIVNCDFVSVNENGNIVEQEHATFMTGQMDQCRAKWVPLGVSFCNTHSLPAAWMITWGTQGGPLLEKKCPEPGKSQVYPCYFEIIDVFGRGIYGNTAEAATESDCLAQWNVAVHCQGKPNATHNTFFNYDKKLVRTGKCPLPAYSCAISFVGPDKKVIFQETVQKTNQTECLSHWTTVLNNTCKNNPAATYKATFNNSVINTGTCPGTPPPPTAPPVKPLTTAEIQGSLKNSCNSINYDGNADKVTAQCKRKNGTWNNSANYSNCRQCISQGGELANCDGNIDCINANLPNVGSYKNSCWCCRMDGTTLRCHCNKKGSGSNWTGLDNARSYRDIWNDNGTLKGR